MGVRRFTLVAVIGVLGALIVGSSSAKTPRTVALSVNITGAGTVRVGSHVVSCAGMACHQIVPVQRGSRVVIRTTPAAGWKFTTWAGACKGSGATCSLQLRAGSDVGVNFVPPGVRSNPYPLHAAVTLVGGWRVRINSDTIKADEQVEAVRDESGLVVNAPPPAGAQYALVNVSVTYVGAGANGFEDYLFGAIKAEGVGKVLYEPTCTPPQPVGSIDPLLSGRTDSGNLCYEIASVDATSLLLTGFAAATGARTAHYPFTRPVWFALR
jgi:hypothetical protein